MSIDFNEARAIIEAAKKRGAIRAPGSDEPAAQPPRAGEKEAERVILPEWLRNEISAPSSMDKPTTPMWRSAE